MPAQMARSLEATGDVQEHATKPSPYQYELHNLKQKKQDFPTSSLWPFVSLKSFTQVCRCVDDSLTQECRITETS
jgi:hypothetical protein